MAKYIVKVEKGPTNTRLNLPKELLVGKCWFNVQYVILEDHIDDTILIRRFIDGESLKREAPRG